MTHDDLGDDGFAPDISAATGNIDSHMTGRNDSHMTSWTPPKTPWFERSDMILFIPVI